jgi:hypothetical protein
MITFSIWNHHRLDIRILPDAIWIGLNHVFFILFGYGILGFFGGSFPGRFSLLQIEFIACGIVGVCLFVGYWLDWFLSHYNWWK